MCKVGLFICIAALALASESGLHAQERVIEFPSPTGAHAIGRTTLRWTDATREEAMTDKPNDRRELTVHLWYPAEATATATVAPYFPDLEALKKEVKLAGAFRLARARALADAPVAASSVPYPLILFLHGNEMNSAQYSFLIEELVSHGYVVAGIDSPGEARGAVLSGGRTLGYGDSKWEKTDFKMDPKLPMEEQALPKFYRARVDVRVADASFVLNQLTKLDVERGNRFAGRFDLTRVGVFGHSHGGVAAANAGIADARFKACLTLDGMAGRGPYFPDAGGNGPSQPFLLLLRKQQELSDKDLEKIGQTREQFRLRLNELVNDVFGRLKSDRYRIVINGPKHNSFSDDGMMEAALLKPKELDAQRRYASIVRAYTLAFFDRYLRGAAAPLLEAATPDYPEVEFRKWKK